MDYKYKVTMESDDDRWIFIHYEDWDEPEGFVQFVKRVRAACNGKIIAVGDERYKIVGAEVDLIYQFDDLFGMVIEYPDDCPKEKALDFIKRYF